MPLHVYTVYIPIIHKMKNIFHMNFFRSLLCFLGCLWPHGGVALQGLWACDVVSDSSGSVGSGCCGLWGGTSTDQICLHGASHGCLMELGSREFGRPGLAVLGLFASWAQCAMFWCTGCSGACLSWAALTFLAICAAFGPCRH